MLDLCIAICFGLFGRYIYIYIYIYMIVCVCVCVHARACMLVHMKEKCILNDILCA